MPYKQIPFCSHAQTASGAEGWHRHPGNGQGGSCATAEITLCFEYWLICHKSFMRLVRTEQQELSF